MSILNSSEISEVKAFRSNLKTSIGTPIENSGLVLILCVEGCAVLSINFKEYSFRKGDIAIIPIGMTLIPLKTSSLFQAEIRCVTEQHCEEMEYRISDIPFWNFMMEHPILHPTSIQYNMLSGWFAQMQWAMSDRSFSFYNETISSGIFTLFMMIYKEVKAYVQEPDKEQTGSRTMQLFTAFTNLVTRYHKREREVAYYANMLSITPDYLNKVCKMHWETTAKEYIDRQVVMAIKNDLTCTDLSIKCIAAQLNFDDSSYMCRFFKKQTGLSPLEYRDNESIYRNNSH